LIKYLTLILVLVHVYGFSQTSKIKILHADQTYRNQKQYPDAMVLNGDVKIKHQGALLTCKKALFYQSENRLYAYGDVYVNQADTLTQKSDHLQYDGNSQKALSWGNVVVKDNEITLSTDTLGFNRITQVLKYDCFGTIIGRKNKLTSQVGEYFAHEKKLRAVENVKVVNPDMDLKTAQMDYYTTTGRTYLYGPSTIVNKENTIYTEKGIYDTKLSIGYLLKNSTIYHESNEITGDSLYYNELKSFASGTGNLVIKDTVNNITVTGDYGEVYRAKDSIIITKKPLAISTVEKDTMFIHGDTLSITGTQDHKLMKIYHHVKFFKTDLRGKCDSLVSKQGKGITELFRNPVLWSADNQITGDSIRLINNLKTNKLDSLNIIKNALIVQKDSLGYNQIRGKNMFGKFKNQKLNSLLVKGNGAVINYARDEEGVLSAIMDMECSNIQFNFNESKIQSIRFLKEPDGTTYPPEMFPKEREKTKGFIWRESERPLKKEDIFIHD